MTPRVPQSRAARALASVAFAAWLRRAHPPDDRGRDRPAAISAWLSEHGVPAPPVTVRHWLRGGKLPRSSTLSAIAPLVASPDEWDALVRSLYLREQP